MAAQTKVYVRLTPEGRNVLGGIEWAVLDLNDGFSTRKSKDVQALSDVNEILTEGILSVSFPFSTTNDAAFMQYSSPVITDNVDTGIEVRVVEGSDEEPFDRIFFKEKTDSSRQWEMEFRRSPNHWAELSSEKKLCSIDCGTATLDEATVLAGWAEQGYVDGGAVERWIPTDYGGWVDLAEPIQFTDPPVKNIWLEDLRPWLSEVYLLKQGFCEIGWTLEGQIFDTPWARAQFVYILSREYYTESKGGNHKLIGANLIADFSPLSLAGSAIPYDSVQYDPGTNALPAGPFYYGGITNNLPFKGKWKFCFSGTLENTGGAGNTIGFTIFSFDLGTGFPDGQALYDEPAAFTLGAGEIRFVSFCQEIELEVGQTAVFWVGYSDTVILKKGYRMTFEPANKSLVRGDVVQIERLINCELYLLDMFKGFVHKCNGRIETDWPNRTVSVHPYRTADVAGDSVPGFIRDGETPIDLSGVIICESIKLSPVKNNLSRYSRYSFAPSTDAYVESLELVEPPFSRKILNSLELPDKVQDFQNPFYEPTLEGQNDELKRNSYFPSPNLPRLYDNMQGERSFNIGPRVLFFYGMIVQSDKSASTFVNGLTAAFYFEGALTTEFGYASHLPTYEFADTFEPVLYSTLVYGKQPSDLYVMFYLAMGLTNKRGMWADALVYMEANDYAAWDFRTLFSFFYEGTPVVAFGENIRDFAPSLELPTPMRLLISPSVTACCELPCSCRFRECDYFQDFGQYITQDTLDELSITSFKVNGIEQLTEPVDFGIINVIHLNGKQFVTNLVDALNGLEIDYFAFAPSTKDYPEKDDLRYFKIKHPACWNFEIIISGVEAEVYRYRDYDHHQQWFDATWEPFGYAGNPVSVPADCVFTTEY